MNTRRLLNAKTIGGLKMERIRFGATEGRNGKIYTVNGFVALFGGGAGHGSGKTGRCSLEISGPNGGVRSIAVLDRAAAEKLGTALLKWAGVLTYELTPEAANADLP